MRVLILCAAIALAGCQTTKPVIVETVDFNESRVPPQEAMAKCQTPSKLQDGKFATVISKLKETVDMLNECSSKRDELEDYIKRGLKKSP